MPSEVEKNSQKAHEAGLGSLRGCLVEGDAEQRRRESRVRRRAIVISIVAQTAVLAALVLVPLFGKTERLAAKEWVPIPPYGRLNRQPVGERRNTKSHPSNPTSPFIFNPNGSRPHPHAEGNTNAGGATGDLDSLQSSSNVDGPVCAWCPPGGNTSGPRVPPPLPDTRVRPEILHFRSLDPAMLLHRVEPTYPYLAKVTHKQGRVELRAIIATDGSIQSLEIVSGDPLFYQSAKEAVSQWHYRPTFLNGKAVEIDTYITVIYSMQH